MASLISSVAEDAGFRGYFQAALESRFVGPAVIFVPVLLIAPAHARPTVLFYSLVDSMLGISAYLTKSILPSLAVHSLGLLTFFGLIWPQDRQRVLVWGRGADIWFWIHVAQAVVFAGFAVLSYLHLARLTQGVGQKGAISSPE